MTEDEIRKEWIYVYNERLALLGWFSQSEPPPEFKALAISDADHAISRLSS